MNEISFEFFVPRKYLPAWFEYPDEYTHFVKNKLPDLDPWHFYYSLSDIEFHFKGLSKRYPSRSIVPFARRGDNDDVACFDASEYSANPRVLIIHDFASPGWENRGMCETFNQWVELAKAESREYKARRYR